MTHRAWFSFALAAAAAIAGISPAHAATYTNVTGIIVDIAEGDIAFADQVVSYSPGLVPDPDLFNQLVPLLPFRNSAETLGVPDLTTAAAQNCATGFFTSNPTLLQDCNFASLGVGPTVTTAGSLVVRFTDNVLSGGGNADFDLWIFETGPDVEDTFVDVSADGNTWQSVGKVGGSSSGVDLDFFGFGTDDIFTYVRLTDDGLEGDGSPGASNVGETVGADIDAIAAGRISVVPAPAAGWLALTAFLALGRRLRIRPR